jgi:hypothetical protein
LKEESFENQKNDIEEQSPIKILLSEGTKHLRAICSSKVIDALLVILNDYENQPQTLSTLTEMISYMMMYNRLAYELCEKGALHLIFEIMLRCNDFRCELVKTGFEIFWSAI